MDEYDFNERLTRLRPVLQAGGLDALSLYAELVDQAVLKEKPGRNVDLYWQVWRPWLGSAAQFGSVADSLLTAMRDDAEELARRSPHLITDMVETLVDRGGIYERLAWYILSLTLEGSETATVTQLGRESVWRSRFFAREFAGLVMSGLPLLDGRAIEQVLRWIELGPDARDDDDEQFLRLWRYRHLDLVEQVLDQARMQELRRMRDELGPPDLPWSVRPVEASFIGPTSPVSADELRAGGADLILAWLLQWQPSQGWAQPTPAGLGRELAKVVEAWPTVVDLVADHRGELHPTYIRSVLEGVRQALTNGVDVSSTSVIALANYVVHASRDVPELGRDAFEFDRDWEPAKRSALWAVQALLAARTPTRNQLTAMWKVIEPLLGHPEPTPDHEATYGTENMDWATLALNTTRPLAVLTAVDLVRKAEGDSLGATDRRDIQTSLDLLLIDDKALSVRAALGQSYPLIRYSWPEWAIGRKEHFFPLQPNRVESWWAAWSTYLGFYGPTPDLMDELRPSYLAALERATTKPKWRYFQDPTDRLGEHLVIAYANGWLTGESGLWREAQRIGSAELWIHATRFAGISVARDDVPSATTDRLRRLWEARRSEFEKGNAVPSELAEFGWWFVSTKLPEAWVLENLDWVLRHSKLERTSAWAVTDRLATLVETAPTRVLTCAALMVDAATEPWELFAWRQSIQALFDKTAGQTDVTVRRLRFELASRLAAKGMLEFRDFVDDRDQTLKSD